MSAKGRAGALYEGHIIGYVVPMTVRIDDVKELQFM
jgi:hypothetical protein